MRIIGTRLITFNRKYYDELPMPPITEIGAAEYHRIYRERHKDRLRAYYSKWKRDKRKQIPA